jgi:spore coat protein U-like protein
MRHHQELLYQLTAGVIFFFLLCPAVHAGCRVSATSINFGSYDVFSSTATTSTGSITLSCSPKADVRIDIRDSSNSGSYFPRRMQHSSRSDTLEYNLYTSANSTQVWGDGNHGTTHVHATNVKSNNTPPIIIYGMIPPLQNVSTGIYSDQLVVTITF